MGILAAAGTLLLAGCSTAVSGTARPLRITDAERTLVTGYFITLNETGRQGTSAQRELLRDTQHPDFREDECDLPKGTIRIDPAMSTLRMDPDWEPSGQKAHPRGTVYAVAASITLLLESVEIGRQIGSLHIVLLDEKAYGFAPCVAG